MGTYTYQMNSVPTYSDHVTMFWAWGRNWYNIIPTGKALSRPGRYGKGCEWLSIDGAFICPWNLNDKSQKELVESICPQYA